MEFPFVQNKNFKKKKRHRQKMKAMAYLSEIKTNDFTSLKWRKRRWFFKNRTCWSARNHMAHTFFHSNISSPPTQLHWNSWYRSLLELPYQLYWKKLIKAFKVIYISKLCTHIFCVSIDSETRGYLISSLSPRETSLWRLILQLLI